MLYTRLIICHLKAVSLLLWSCEQKLTFVSQLQAPDGSSFQSLKLLHLHFIVQHRLESGIRAATKHSRPTELWRKSVTKEIEGTFDMISMCVLSG